MTKQSDTEFHVLIAAAGNGSRVGSDIPKQYRKIAGKAVLRYSLERFLSLPGLKSIRVIYDPAHADLYHEAVKGLDLPEPIAGGKTRKESVFLGLNGFSKVNNKEIILIHDAARPLFSLQDVRTLTRTATTSGAATLASPVADTLRRGHETIDRSGVWAIQTPQAFRLELLQNAHEKFKANDNFTDDAGMVSEMGHSVEIVSGGRENFKITTEDDLKMAEKLLLAAMETRSGSGFDVHAFDTVGSGPLRIGGIDIPHERKLAGHSDADVGLHALTDALLGCIAAGDIGSHFPPSDPQWKGADSKIFLKEAAQLIEDKGGLIRHVDLTLICEEPKIGPHREAMQKRIGDILGLPPARVSIKATTTEGLGFTGRREGIAAQACATISLPLED